VPVAIVCCPDGSGAFASEFEQDRKRRGRRQSQSLFLMVCFISLVLLFIHYLTIVDIESRTLWLARQAHTVKGVPVSVGIVICGSGETDFGRLFGASYYSIGFEAVWLCCYLLLLTITTHPNFMRKDGCGIY
jgi:ABC-type transport system involved in multi-copper enzyme maturation permease subunit